MEWQLTGRLLKEAYKTKGCVLGTILLIPTTSCMCTMCVQCLGLQCSSSPELERQVVGCELSCGAEDQTLEELPLLLTSAPSH